MILVTLWFWACWVEVSGASSWTVWAPGPLGIESLWVAVLETVLS